MKNVDTVSYKSAAAHIIIQQSFVFRILRHLGLISLVMKNWMENKNEVRKTKTRILLLNIGPAVE